MNQPGARPGARAQATAGSHTALRAALSVAVVRFEAGRLVTPRGGFLRSRTCSGGPHACGCGPVNIARLGAGRRWDRPRCRRLRRRASACWGRRSFGSAPAPAGTDRCPHGSGSNPSPRPSQRGRVALCRLRCQSLRLLAPPKASVDGRAAAPRPGPHEWPVAGLDSTTRFEASVGHSQRQGVWHRRPSRPASPTRFGRHRMADFRSVL